MLSFKNSQDDLVDFSEKQKSSTLKVQKKEFISVPFIRAEEAFQILNVSFVTFKAQKKKILKESRKEPSSNWCKSHTLTILQASLSRSPGIVVRDADRCFVGPWFESGEDMDVCKCVVSSRHGGTVKRSRVAISIVKLVEGEERWEVRDHPRVFSLKIGVEPSQIMLSPVWCSKLRLKTGIRNLPLAAMTLVYLDLMLLSIRWQQQQHVSYC
ncbi:uncharacterized protein TNCV_1075481 [Trichonephila clavipes]|uniref:Uncharacterized protein n=1 Tax=Trichonephila clavipes TaxID=2585209 RepID=A0A8X6VQI1_TRICX|nr:uncharacterized protein TNCV_1075481 [Trichonephila clavipes]